MPKRWCFTCRGLYDRDTTGTWRCPTCQPAVDAARRARATAGRPSTTARGYGAVYRRRAEVIVAQGRAAAMAGSPQPCGICSGPCLAGEQLVAHHPDGRPHLADPSTCVLVLAHAACNSGHRP